MQVWGYIYAEWASTETFMLVFLVVFSHPEIVIKKIKIKKMHGDSKHPFGLCKTQRLRDASRFFCRASYKSWIYPLPWWHHRRGTQQNAQLLVLLPTWGQRREERPGPFTTCVALITAKTEQQQQKTPLWYSANVYALHSCSWPWRSCRAQSCCGQQWNQASMHVLYALTAPLWEGDRGSKCLCTALLPACLTQELWDEGLSVFYPQLYVR